jgi:hypothetical protein
MAHNDFLSSHQKVALGIFIVIGMMTLVLGAASISNAIEEPFRKDGKSTFKTTSDLEEERDVALRNTDTDADTLTDYDELYAFRTSPFLPDSDSDGIDDGEEIATESDPNCPQGKTCRQAPITSTNAGIGMIKGAGDTLEGGSAHVAESSTSVVEGNSAGQATPDTDAAAKIMAVITETFGDPNKLTTERIAQGIAAMSTDDLRVFLAKLGVPQPALEKADDLMLRQLVSEALSEIAQ